MGCSPGSKFTCILSCPAAPAPVVPRRRPSGPRSSFLAAVVVATTRCLSETPRATLVEHRASVLERTSLSLRAKSCSISPQTGGQHVTILP